MQFLIPDRFKNDLSVLKNEQVLVTGGCGFLGRNLCHFLLEIGCKVRILDLNIIHFTDHSNIEFVKGNLLKENDIKNALKNVKIVFHTASPSPLSKNKIIFQKVNVGAMQNLIKCCQNTSVDKFINVSSASVVFDGNDQFGLTEFESKNIQPFSDYAKSKLMAEQILLEMEGRTFSACSIRPHSIFGPDDQNFIPSLIKAAKDGKNKYKLGNGRNLVDFTYVDNVSFSLVLAASKLTKNSKINNESYFITNKKIINFWDFLSEIYENLGYSSPYIPLPESLLLVICKFIEKFNMIFPQMAINSELSRDKVLYSTKHHFYSCEKANSHFGYTPIVSFEEGKERTLKHFKNQRTKTSQKKASSKIFFVIGVLLFVLSLMKLTK